MKAKSERRSNVGGNVASLRRCQQLQRLRAVLLTQRPMLLLRQLRRNINVCAEFARQS